jgi:phosphatidylglycerophosphatase A
VRRLVIALATAGGVGYAPVAPGTWGALVAVPFLPWLAALRARAPVCYGALLAGMAAVGVWAAGRAEVVFGGKDHSRIVIDEVAGQLVAGAFVPGTWVAAGLAFVLFRLFDVAKPYPASFFDRRVPGGLGVVGDDLVAGAYAGLVAWVVLRLV